MTHFLRLRALTLAFLVLAATGCDQQEADPQPTTPVQPMKPVQVTNPAKHHTVAVRYYFKAFGDTSALPTIPPNIEVDYERVMKTALPPYSQLLGLNAQFHDLKVTSTVKEVSLPSIATYPDAIKPKITLSVWVDQAPPADSEGGYEVVSELIIDGQVAGRSTFKAVAGQKTPLEAVTQIEVAH
jgi:hypothetical protein